MHVNIQAVMKSWLIFETKIFKVKDVLVFM